MNAMQRLFGATHPAGVEPPEPMIVDDQLLRQLKARAARLPDEGRMASFDGATTWLNSPPLTREELQGSVVVVQFWTYTCVNWLRTLPYVRAWAQRYGDNGLVVIGVHTPEFPFERNLDNIRTAAKDMRLEYPIAVDSGYAVWHAFDNNYWPALYLVDAVGRVRFHHYGEGAYDMSEMVIQQLLADAGYTGFAEDLVSVQPEGTEVAADWNTLESGETYVGHARAENFASPGGVVPNRRHTYSAPSRLRTNEWALTGDWTVTEGFARLNQEGGRIAFRFHARDVNLVMGPAELGNTMRFRVSVDGRPANGAHGADVGDDGQGIASEQRLYQLLRQSGFIDDRTFEIEFLDAGIEAYCFTFG